MGLLELRWVLLSMVVVLAILLGAVLLAVLRWVLLVILRWVLLLVVALVPGGVVADIVVSLTVISLIVREHRKWRSTRTPVVGLAMRSRRRDHFLASMVESPETTALLRWRETT
jgi:hypothetical protein